MRFLILSQIVLGFVAGDETVKCPVLARTAYKEQRKIDYSECGGWKKCFQEIRLFEVAEDGTHAFLYASGCATPEPLKPFGQTEIQFLELCEQKKVARCVHRYQNHTYAGTMCCENDADEVFVSWLWDVFFGDSDEMSSELESTVKFVQNWKKGLHNHNKSIIFPIIFTALVILVFTALELLQYYHINEGIIS